MKNCLNCNEEFEPNSGKQKFCSDKCKVAYSRRPKEEKMEDADELEEVIEQPKTKLVVENKVLKEKATDAVWDKIRESHAKINKDFGEGTIMLFGDKPNTKLDVVSTGSILLDKATGIGGLPRGRFTEIYGAESSGKTTITLHVIANAQKGKLKCLLIDAENSFDPEYAEALGINVGELAYCQPMCAEEAFEVADKKIASGEADVVVIDSVAALVPKAELEGAVGDSRMGLMARIMSQACRIMVGTVSKRNALLIFINQIRNKIGIMYGNPEVTTGGMALQFYASIRLQVIKTTEIKNGEVQTGRKTKVKVVKNKCAPPFRSAEFDIVYGIGIDKTGEIVDLAVEEGVIKKSGTWYSYGEMKLGQGRNTVIDILNDNEAVKIEIENKLNLNN